MEDARTKRQKLLKRSYDHEFTKKGSGYEERKAHVKELAKKFPTAGKFGF